MCFSLLIKWIGEFTNSKIASFPYGLAAKVDQSIYSTDSVPEGFILSDPDHLTGFQIQALYGHWLKRQQKKLSPFVILNSSPQHHISYGKSSKAKEKSSKAKGKRKIDYMEVDSNDEEVKTDGGEEEEDDVEVKEDDDGMPDEDDEEMSPVVKYGPPITKSKKNQLLTQIDEHANAIAGPSKLRSGKQPLKKNPKPSNDGDPIQSGQTLSLPPPKNPLKKETLFERPNTRKSSKNTDSKKRKPEEDLTTAPPPKVLKSDRNRKSGRRTGEIPLEEPVKVSDPNEA